MNKFYIIHGWGGTPGSNWFDWLRLELIERGYEAKVPQLPNTENPREGEWLEQLNKLIREPDGDTYLIGHSLGVMAILRYLESLEKGIKIGGALLVAGFAESVGIPEIDNFFEKEIDWEKVKKQCKKFVVINSDNDQHVPLEMGERLAKGLNVELKLIKNAGHFMTFESSLILDESIRLVNNK